MLSRFLISFNGSLFMIPSQVYAPGRTYKLVQEPRLLRVLIISVAAGTGDSGQNDSKRFHRCVGIRLYSLLYTKGFHKYKY
jgi:hypothetical protein